MSIPATYDKLCGYLATTSPSKLTKNSSSPLSGEESFDTFLESVCSDSADSCHSFLCAFEAFACNAIHAKEYTGEMEVVSLVDAALLPLQVLLRTKTGRNSKTASTGNKLPDFKMTVGNAKIPIFLGEEKTFISRKDPKQDLEAKSPWDKWEDFYGELPYYFAYTCVGGSASVDFTLGVMDRQSRKFMPLQSNDISDPSQRSEFSIALVKCFPIFKAIAQHCVQHHSLTGAWSMEKSLENMTRKMGTVIVSNQPVFRKEWVYHGSSATEQAASFYNRMQNVFIRLSEKGGPDGLTFMCLYEPMHVTENVVKAHFVPFAKRVEIQNEQQLLTSVLTIARAVQHLHSIGIIHNDIRWDNIMQSDGIHFLVDFDDAYYLADETSTCPPLTRLGADEHSPRSFQDHRGEVDCWSIGRLLLTSPFRAISEHTREASRYCQANDGAGSSIDDIVKQILDIHTCILA